jgi:hypothetical protein
MTDTGVPTGLSPKLEQLHGCSLRCFGVMATGRANIVGYYFDRGAGSAHRRQAINAVLRQSNDGDN